MLLKVFATRFLSNSFSPTSDSNIPINSDNFSDFFSRLDVKAQNFRYSWKNGLDMFKDTSIFGGRNRQDKMFNRLDAIAKDCPRKPMVEITIRKVYHSIIDDL